MNDGPGNIKPGEAPVFLEFIWLSTLTLLAKSMTGAEIEQIAELASERSRGFGASEDDLKKFHSVITKLANHQTSDIKAN